RESRRLRARLLPMLELRRSLPTIKFIEFGRSVGVVHGGIQMLGRHELEEIQDSTFARPDTHRRNQHQLAKLRRIAGSHLRGYPTTHRKAYRVDRGQVLLVQITSVEARHIANIANPFGPWRAAESRML